MKRISFYHHGLLLIVLMTSWVKTFSQTITYAGSHNYTAGVAITPASPTVTGISTSPQVSTLAGNPGVSGSTNGTGSAATFYHPSQMAVDASGNLYLADEFSNKIRKITSSGVVTTLAGSGTQNSVDGTGAGASFNYPSGVAIDPTSGNLFVTDYGSNKIRKVTPAGVVTTFAGSGAASVADGQGTAASFWGPIGIAIDPSGNIFVGDYTGARIRKITPSGYVTTLAGSGTQVAADGTGTAASFNYPSGIKLDASGNIYVADRSSDLIRKVTPSGVVTTVAGVAYAEVSTDGTGAAGKFYRPSDLVFDASGNLYITDYSSNKIRKLSPLGMVSTVAGSGSAGSAGGAGNVATFNGPFGINIDATGNLYVADIGTHIIRKIVVPQYSISPALPTGLSFDKSTGIISGTPTSGLASTSYNVSFTSSGTTISTSVVISVSGGTSSPSNDQNYIATYTPRIALQNITKLESISDVNQSIAYFDNLGRPMQTVQVKGNADATKDVIQPVGYDDFGRESVKYLPYGDGTGAAGSYRSNALSGGQGNFYYTPPTGVAQNLSPYSQTLYEPSPENRVIEQGAPGSTWQPSNGHTQKIVYGVNAASSVRYFVVSNNLNTGAGYARGLTDNFYYDAGDLYLTITKSENWTAADGKMGTVEEYKNREGNIILRRVYKTNTIALSTYYVYDFKGNLTYIIPPAADPDNGNIPAAKLSNLCYQYFYDGRNRLIEKRVPGKGWDFMVYNKADQLVLSQDSVQRINQKWLFTKYDELGRQVLTGTYTSANSRIQQQGTIDGLTVLSETRTNTGVTGYSNVIYPIANTTVLTVNYYDDYSFPNASTVAPQGAYSNMGHSLLTGTLVYTLDGLTSYLSADYYDDEGRLKESVRKNQLANGTDRTINVYSFTGALISSTLAHLGNSATTTLTKSYVYDHMDRKRQSSEQINSSAVVLSKIDLNDIGQSYIKHLHSDDSGVTFLQDITYTYNERGWLRTANTSGNLFNFELKYDAPEAGVIPKYNGNVTQMLYNTTGVPGFTARKFTYTYDALDRLKSSVSNTLDMDETINYATDQVDMGDFTSLVRTGVKGANLTYNYTDANNNLTNRLFTVKNNNTAYRSYTYDGNGNALSDGNIGGNSIIYNMLNLPQTVKNSSGTQIASYIYDATGTKLRNVGSDGTWDYDGDIVYKNNSIAYIRTEEGEARPNGSGGYNYQYDLKDHLGNIRVTFRKFNGAANIVQEDEYYSFGLRKAGGYDNSNLSRYLYNGKEMQTDLANQYDYGARLYDPLIARWTSVDPLTEDNANVSPYNYASNNPLNKIDPDGMDDRFTRDPDFGLLGLEGGLANESISASSVASGDEGKADKDKDKDPKAKDDVGKIATVGIVLNEVKIAATPIGPVIAGGAIGWMLGTAISSHIEGFSSTLANILVHLGVSSTVLYAPAIIKSSLAIPKNLPWSKGKSPGKDWTWKGKGNPESGKGNWVNDQTGQKLHPDFDHPDPKGPHWGLQQPDGGKYDIYPDGRVEPNNK